jgi:hypothetical protein
LIGHDIHVELTAALAPSLPTGQIQLVERFIEVLVLLVLVGRLFEDLAHGSALPRGGDFDTRLGAP